MLYSIVFRVEVFRPVAVQSLALAQKDSLLLVMIQDQYK
jgi:hypothetical protein